MGKGPTWVERRNDTRHSDGNYTIDFFLVAHEEIFQQFKSIQKWIISSIPECPQIMMNNNYIVIDAISDSDMYACNKERRTVKSLY
mmetsp:Transcript_3927/g.5676  ORF Transcript_3927/g.5676 Transcript_3927/m.5676 type:complete len:86 (+) Transcript_3927:375-632(+)